MNSPFYSKDKFKESLKKVRDTIISGLDGNFEKSEVFEKYNWLKNQYNNLLSQSFYDYETNKGINFDLKIKNLFEGIKGPNIHYSMPEEISEKRKK